MMRKIIVVGDPPAPGGVVLPYEGPTSDMHGHQLALIGGRAYCEGCNSVGILAKAGGPRRAWFHNAEIALEGDVVVCHCPAPPMLVATLVHSVVYDDFLAAAVSEFQPSFAALPSWFSGDPATVAASKKVVDEMVKHPPQAEQSEKICPNMTNKEFCSLVLELRADAVKMVERRLKDLGLWGKAEKSRVATWFGTDDEGTRQYLRKGLTECLRVLKELTCGNFVRYSDESMRRVGCVAEKDMRLIAAGVCKSDVRTHTIGINIVFCDLRDRSAEGDSQLQTLLHEVIHFDDTFSTDDDVYSMSRSLTISQDTKRALKNTDSIAGYVAFGVSYEG